MGKSFAFGTQRGLTQTGHELFLRHPLTDVRELSGPCFTLKPVEFWCLEQALGNGYLGSLGQTGRQVDHSIYSLRGLLHSLYASLCANGFELFMLCVESTSQRHRHLSGWEGYCQHVPFFQSSTFGLLHFLDGCLCLV